MRSGVPGRGPASLAASHRSSAAIDDVAGGYERRRGSREVPADVEVLEVSSILLSLHMGVMR